MKSIITILIVLFSATTFAQDSSKVKPTYLFERTDTIQVFAATYGEREAVKYSQPAYAIYKGFKNDKGQWSGQPTLIGVLDNKKRSIKNPLQIL